MASERAAFLTQMVEVLTSTVSFGERLDNMVHLLARHPEGGPGPLFRPGQGQGNPGPATSAARAPWRPICAWNSPWAQGLVGEAAETRKIRWSTATSRGCSAANAALEKLQPGLSDPGRLSGGRRQFSLRGPAPDGPDASAPSPPPSARAVQLTCLMLAGTLRQAIVQEEAKKRIAELSVLFEVGKAISSTVELDELLQRIVSTTAKVITARGAALHIIDAATGRAPGLLPLWPDPARHARPCPGCPGSAGAARSLPYFEGQSTNATGRVHYCLAVPLTFKGQLHGTLGVYDKFSPGGEYLPFDPENRQLLFTMAGVIVNAMENALTYQQVEDLAEKNERMVRNLTALQEISQVMLTTVQEERLLEIILQGLTQEQGLGFDRAVMFMVDEATQTLKGRQGADRPPPSQATCQSQRPAGCRPPEPIPVSDWRDSPRGGSGPPGPGGAAEAALPSPPDRQRSGLARLPGGRIYAPGEFFVVPLVVKDRATGVIVVDNQASGRPLEPEPLHALQMFATQAALVLENAHLYSTIEANNRELLLIRERMLEVGPSGRLEQPGLGHGPRDPQSPGVHRRLRPAHRQVGGGQFPLAGLRGGHPGGGDPPGKAPAGNPGFHRRKSVLLRGPRTGQAHRGHAASWSNGIWMPPRSRWSRTLPQCPGSIATTGR